MPLLLRRVMIAAAVLLVVTLASAFAWLVWPTPWRSVAVTSSVPYILAAKENRFTGCVEFLRPAGWTHRCD